MDSKKSVLKNSSEQLIAKNLWETGWAYIRNIIDTAREPFLILDEKLVIVAANEYFYNFFKVSKEETEGNLVYKLGNGQWNVPWLKKLLEEIIPKNEYFNNFEVDHTFPTIGRRIMVLNARRVHYPKKVIGLPPALIILAMEDASKERLIEERLKNYSKKLESEVLKRTKELSERVERIEKLNTTMVDREIKMIELKKVIENIKSISKDQEIIIKDLNKELFDLKKYVSSK